ncbi:MAG: Trk system potassium transporter TrkA [Bacteroidales bacterium]|nr:Trk system potassium transporter TrkA [Bacteroidales bacterium]
MKIVIVGAGEVGQHIAKLLSSEEQDIVLIDSDETKLERIDANYNLMTLKGSPTSFETLKAAGTHKADLFIAVTPSEDKNLMACTIAKDLGASRTVARIDNYEYLLAENRDFFLQHGINDMIYPEQLAALEIKTALKRSWVRQWFELHKGELVLVGVKVYENAAIVGAKLRDMTFTNNNFHISAITRRHETIIPGGNDEILAGDIIYVTTTPENVDDLRQLCGKDNHIVRNVMIMGASRIAVRLAALLGADYRIKIIENNREVCRRLPERCPNCEIIYGDARDNDILLDEGIEDMDAFIALTDSSETNILASLSAKEFGVKKTIAEVENIQFISEAEGLNIGTIINKKLLASSKIFQILLAADSESSKFLSLADAEVAELEVKPGSKITRSPVKDLKLSRDMTIGGLVRDGRGMLVTGGTLIQPGDRVVVFCLSGVIHKIEKLFG